MKYKKIDSEYYVMNSSSGPNYPLLGFCKAIGALDYAEPIDESTLKLPIEVGFSGIMKAPKNPIFPDALDVRGALAVSDRIKLMFESMNLHGVQLFPVKIITPKDEEVAGFWLMHIWNEIKAIDLNNYVGGPPDRFGGIISLAAFSLDEAVLQKIEPEKRLIFKLVESTSLTIIHQSVYDAIKAINPEGFFFRKVSEWGIGSQFDK